MAIIATQTAVVRSMVVLEVGLTARRDMARTLRAAVAARPWRHHAPSDRYRRRAAVRRFVLAS
jgi:hypothetical protein